MFSTPASRPHFFAHMIKPDHVTLISIAEAHLLTGVVHSRVAGMAAYEAAAGPQRSVLKQATQGYFNHCNVYNTDKQIDHQILSSGVTLTNDSKQLTLRLLQVS